MWRWNGAVFSRLERAFINGFAVKRMPTHGVKVVVVRPMWQRVHPIRNQTSREVGEREQWHRRRRKTNASRRQTRCINLTNPNVISRPILPSQFWSIFILFHFDCASSPSLLAFGLEIVVLKTKTKMSWKDVGQVLFSRQEMWHH